MVNNNGAEKNINHENQGDHEIDISASTAYDDPFRTMISFCSRLLIPVINEVFGTNYDENAIIAAHNNEHYINYGKGMQDKLITIAISLLMEIHTYSNVSLLKMVA